jgi:hypothetical protein
MVQLDGLPLVVRHGRKGVGKEPQLLVLVGVLAGRRLIAGEPGLEARR